MLNPNKLGTMLQRLFIPVTEFTGRVFSFTVGSGSIGANMEIGIAADSAGTTVEGNAGVTASRQLITGEVVKMHSASVNNPPFEELGTLGVSGCKMNTAGDRIDTFGTYLLDKMSFRHPVQGSVIWTCDSTTITDTVAWKIFSNDISPNTAAIGALTESVLLTADNVIGTATKVVHETARGTLASALNSNTAKFLHLGVEMDAKVGITEDIWLLGLMLYYTERKGRGLQKLARRFARSQD
jgi:hypothetical protein